MHSQAALPPPVCPPGSPGGGAVRGAGEGVGRGRSRDEHSMGSSCNGFLSPHHEKLGTRSNMPSPQARRKCNINIKNFESKQESHKQENPKQESHKSP